ncbi:uncharacterized protein LOC116024169 [Ipomoea triloba]|uniref:uncharacterized protein LOC116024169 n=1 Tax=Ipomoea triloba TaxID=35885 RepID=UPI00125E331C|nr:uncharacterized protein LOC116024169 [Ipomoea triloba]
MLDQVRAEFNRWKREEGTDRPTGRSSNLLRTPFTHKLMSEPYPIDPFTHKLMSEPYPIDLRVHKLMSEPYPIDLRVHKLMSEPYPIDLRVPGDKEYAGRSDPEQHVNLYYGNMLMMGVSEAVMCRAFYSTLTGRAAEWFRTLEPESISNFRDLAQRFVDRFAMAKTVKKHFSHLENAKQLDGEPLSVFIERWNKEMSEIEPVDDVTATNLLLNSLRAGNLYQDLILRPPTCYEDAVRRVVAYATATEANSAKRLMETGGSRRDQGQRDRRPNNLRQKDRDGNPIYTPLNRPVAEVLQFAQSCHLIQLPAPARDGPDKEKYCAYHHNRGHDTEECHVLKGLIEDLLQTGELAQFAEKRKKNRRGWRKDFKKDKDKKDKDPDLDREPPAAARKQVIHVIFGGPEGGDTAENRRNWARDLHVALVDESNPEKRVKVEPIVFTNHDLPSSPNCTTEALVVTIDINGVDVQRVMVDTGSSVNVMYLDVFRKLQLDRSQLMPVRTPLSGFTGAMVYPEGVIRLPVEVGTVPRALQVTMEFVVVDLACVHNAILGRPGISQLGAIISMPHLCMKFQTPEGVGTVRGDPQSARRCYVRAVQKQDTSTSRVNTINKKGDARVERPEPSEEVELVPLSDSRPERTVKIGSALSPDLRTAIIAVLQEYADILAWGPEDMPGIDRQTICHRLAVRPGSRPVKQK